ncbi:SET and MYND domain-containing protein 3 [Apophysomyces sp. BC1034]|nr:SET and MYND domain-containing protein 3 [Apophysomyces sp. BC1015]KAG0174270.1 SET and MYND domain-containing protein 3 [Apophysomyces sp. BC1021]KAG0185492.1 SET and MYND domain-containing protein 3 [Apophysomyces sp. BC1034]
MKSVAKLVVLLLWEKQREQAGLRWDRPEPQGLTSTFDHVQALESHYHHWPSSEKKEWRRIQQFLHAQLQLEPDEIMHLVSRIESNGFGIYLENKVSDPIGRALFPLASMFNHDCNNNCEAEQYTDNCDDEAQEIPADQKIEPLDKKASKKKKKNDAEPRPKLYYPPVFSRPRGGFRLMQIKSIRDIQPGEALTISYIDASLPVAARRQQLLSEYYFECQCTRCLEETTKKR